MKRKGRAASASASSPEGKKTKVGGENDPETSTTDSRMVDFSTPKRVAETLLAVADLETFFTETWEKKPYFVKRANTDFYGALFSKKDLEAILKKEEIHFIEDINLSRYVEGKTELLNEEGSRINSKHIKATGVSVQFHQPDRFKVCVPLYIVVLIVRNVVFSPTLFCVKTSGRLRWVGYRRFYKCQ